MDAIFLYLYEIMQGSALIAIFGAFLWGLASILLSPCHLSSIPLIIGFINGKKNETVYKAFLQSLFFGLGILVTIVIIGVITGMMGKMLGDTGIWGYIFLTVFFILFGLILLDIIKMPDFDSPSLARFTKKGFLTSFLVGLIFGIGLGPCTFAFMAPMLGFVFQASANSLSYGILLMVAFAVGHIGIIVFAGTFVEWVEKYLKWSSGSKKTQILKKICGIIVIIAGLYNIKDIIRILNS
ncbi:MAG: cytochrome c biogenesis protein CcdA [Candidatus Delongbacteria bacterium]|jgi:cytochrome c-type biogenesis protein|nr:cytochrome c biogenesis protein CcdA [Candidatus Delongbacteria bacterium]MDD4204648.1 cytochrome c biogenesis protein CcdA [Candidatus Delongbacteria bacterium]